MADNVTITAGAGTTIAADDLGGGVLAQRIKLSLGPDGTGNDALAGSGVNGVGVQRVTIATDDVAVALVNTKLDTLHTDLTTANTQLPSTLAGTASATITRPANATAYTALDIIGTALTFATGLTSGQHAIIMGADIHYDVAAIPAGMTTFRLHLYDVTPPSAPADNAAFDLPAGDRASYLGYLDLSGTMLDLGSTCFIQGDNLNRKIKLNASANVFGLLQTVGGFTPAGNSEVLVCRLHLIGT